MNSTNEIIIKLNTNKILRETCSPEIESPLVSEILNDQCHTILYHISHSFSFNLLSNLHYTTNIVSKKEVGWKEKIAHNSIGYSTIPPLNNTSHIYLVRYLQALLQYSKHIQSSQAGKWQASKYFANPFEIKCHHASKNQK